MVAPLIGTSASNAQAFSPRESAAGRLGPAERADLSVQALAGGEPVTRLAARHNVSRKFVYEQKAKASEALQETFTSLPDDRKVLFHLPVTKDWLRQFVLAQVLIGHTSFRGVMEILDAVFDYGGISIGTIHNIVADAVNKARRINDAQDLSAIAVGAHDEIYQAGQPVLVGADVFSTYCYLLAAEEHCDETTWGVHLLDLSLAGADLPTRRELFAFVTEELGRREGLCPHRIGPVRRMLENRREDLLAFAGIVDERLGEVALRWKVPPPRVHAVCELLGMDPNQPAYWQREAQLHRELRGRFHAVQTEVRQVLAETPRASSIAENINSRLRNYFFLRRHIGNGYLDLLRFFLNHRRFLRSDRPERVGKSPRQLLTAQPHAHWLELLGHERFHRN